MRRSISFNRPSRAATVPPDFHAGRNLLTVTVRPGPLGVIVLAVRGEVDLVSSPLLRDCVLAHLKGAPHVVVDLTGVGFFGAAGITVLITVREAAVAAGIRLCVVAHSRSVLLPLRITEVDAIFDIYPDLAQALLRVGG